MLTLHQEGLLLPVLENFKLDGKAAIVTGASSGLGLSFAQALAEAGADVAVVARRGDRLDLVRKLVERAGRSAVVLPEDVADPTAASRVIGAAVESFGRLDILVNNAGIGTAVPAIREDPEAFRRVIEVNLFGAYWFSQAAARVMLPGSTIINISSVLSLTTAGLPQAAYTASKAGLNGLTRDLAQQWTKRRGIRVNAIAPGFFPSEMTGEYPEGYLDDQVMRIPCGRLGTPEELAATLVYLASDAASYITGQLLVVDGGFSIS